jgi:hypothetical protein
MLFTATLFTFPARNTALAASAPVIPRFEAILENLLNLDFTRNCAHNPSKSAGSINIRYPNN